MRTLLLLRVIIAVLGSDVGSRASEIVRVFGINSLELAVKAIIRLSNLNQWLNRSLQCE